MTKFKASFTCDVCGEKIIYPHFRIEWGHTTRPNLKNSSNFDFIQVCHNDCSYGIKSASQYPSTFGDIIFDQMPYSFKETNDRLNELSQRNPVLSQKITEIKKNLFE